APVLFEPPAALTQDLEIWIAISGTQANYGGADIYLSSDNATYALLGRLVGASRMGTLTAALPGLATAPTGPTIDQSNALAVDIAASGGQLLSVTPARSEE